MGHAAVPDELLQSVVAYFSPRQVILFGSRARGEGGPDSDIDLVVVLDDNAPSEYFSAGAAREARKGFRRSCDIVPWRRSDFYRRARIVGSLPHTILQEGHVVYGEDIEPSAARRMNSGPIDFAAQWGEAQRWIAIADQDLRAVAICLQAEPPATETAAYHCQQAAEKLLKALLVAAARPTRKTHDLDVLASEVAEVHPHLASLADSCRFMTRWGFVYRYPTEPSGVAPQPPTEIEIGRAQAMLTDLRRAIAARGPGESR
jgi:HEPN domain-containing protein/predicted nucleotidyltransferase